MQYIWNQFIQKYKFQMVCDKKRWYFEIILYIIVSPKLLNTFDMYYKWFDVK